MKTTQTFEGLINSQVPSKFIPSSEAASHIHAYFVYNNFQDFNTWQQIAKTKVEYDYAENQKGIFLCKVTLKWEDRLLPTIIENTEARSKKSAKKKALAKLIESIIHQGYIGYGFRQDNFVEKLPRRRKNSSDQSSSQEQQERFLGRNQLRFWLKSKNYVQVFSLLRSDNYKWKHAEALECWHHGLQKANISFLRQILRTLQRTETEQLLNFEENEGLSEFEPARQFSQGKQVKDPLSEDLTDFIRYFQLQKQPNQQPLTRRSPDIRPQPIPSEVILTRLNTHTPSRQQLIQNFHPIEGRKLFLPHLQPPTQFNSFLAQFQNVQVPTFETQQRSLSINIIEQLYSAIFFYSNDYNLCLSTLQLLEQQVRSVSINFQSTVKQKYRQQGEQYYLKQKNLIAAQFLQMLHRKFNKREGNISIEGMVIPQKHEQLNFTFNPKQPEQIVNKKVNRRNNLNEFYQMRQISVGQYVVLLSKFGDGLMLIAQVIQLSPTFKIDVPALTQEFSDPFPFTLTKIYNSKIYQKTSSSLIKASKGCMQLMGCQTHLIWQPPSFPFLAVISELLVEWMTFKSTILIISLNYQQLHTDLIAQGFKAVKLTSKTQQKLLAKCSIVVAFPATVYCDLLKNYAFTRVLVEGAHQISQIMTLPAIVKGCRELYLLGDPFMPRMIIASPLAKAKDMGVSLFQRLYKAGCKTTTFYSQFQRNVVFKSVMQWPNKYIYNQKLIMIGNDQTPIIKGFPWPSYDFRICLLHHQFKEVSYQKYLNEQAFICSFICAQVYKSGYTKLEQITCSTVLPSTLPLLHFHMNNLFELLNISDIKIITKLTERLVRYVTGSQYFSSDLSIMMTGVDNTEISERQILGALQEGRRGVIIIGDMNSFRMNNQWRQFIDWCRNMKLISKIQLNNFEQTELS